MGAALLIALEQAQRAGDGPLQRVMGTDIWRRARTVRVAGGALELAFDVGTIEGGPPPEPRRLAVCELEIELLRGSPQAVVTTARRWVKRHGLWLDTRSKAELGNLLVRDAAMAEPRRAPPVRLSRDLSPAQALDAVLRSCFEQISVNASQMASGEHAPEHVHQLRVGLRRLRTALRFFDGPGLAESIDADRRAAWALAGAQIFRSLGESRDRDAVAGPLATDLQRALAAVGLSGEAPAPPTGGAEVDPVRLVRGPTLQGLQLDLLARALTVRSVPGELPAVGAAKLRDAVDRRLNRWHRQVVADAARFGELDDEGRHRLRKRIKRLRYASEFVADLFDATAVRIYLKRVRALQERLGTVNDVAVGIGLYARAAPTDPRALFALGWLAAQRERALAACRPELERFVEAPRFWRAKSKKSRSK